MAVSSGQIGKRTAEAKDSFLLNVCKGEFTTGTWNIQTLMAIHEIDIQTRVIDGSRWNAVGISELRRTGIGEISNDNGHKI